MKRSNLSINGKQETNMFSDTTLDFENNKKGKQAGAELGQDQLRLSYCLAY